MSIFNKIKTVYNLDKNEMSISDFLENCKTDKSLYASSAERMLAAIGEANIIDTSEDPRLRRIFGSKKIRRYDAFSDFYGMEETIDQIVSFFKHSAQGLEESKQILYFLGPVGSAKSSLAEKIKKLAEKQPVYVLKHKDTVSPVMESPLGLFSAIADDVFEEYGIAQRYIPAVASPWTLKRLREDNGELDNFKVVKIYPNIQNQICISKTEPGDDNNQDISTLVGKVDIRMLGEYDQADADAYSYTGSLCKANQGVMEFVEMFKAPIKVLNPLLTATQEKNYSGTEKIGSIPFNGIIVSHSNQSEWDKFANDKKNEAFLDRVYIVRVPYTLRKSDEVKIYEKMLKSSSLSEAPCAPMTLDLLAEFSVLSRLFDTKNSSVESKMKVYDGEDLKQTDPNAKSLMEYKEDAGITEGMQGISTRFAFKVLSKVFNHDIEEIGANPVHLMSVLEDEIVKKQFPSDIQDKYLNIIKTTLTNNYIGFIGDEIKKSYINSYGEYGQNIFNRYVAYADHWLTDSEFRDETGQMFDRSYLNSELEKIEKAAEISNPKDFRNEVVGFVLRYKSTNSGNPPAWDSYNKMREVIENRIFAQTDEMLPIISFSSSKNSEEDKKKHNDFLERMLNRGYTKKQVQLLVEWYVRVKNNKM